MYDATPARDLVEWIENMERRTERDKMNREPHLTQTHVHQDLSQTCDTYSICGY